MNVNTLLLKVGDKIGTIRGGWNNHYSIEIVKSVSKTGQVTLENGDRYTKDGVKMGESSYCRTYLVPVEQVEKNLADEAARLARNVKHKSVIEFIEKTIVTKTACGTQFFVITPEERDAMIAAINSLEVSILK